MLRREEGGGLCLRGMRNGRGVGGGGIAKMGKWGEMEWVGGSGDCYLLCFTLLLGVGI